MVGGATCFGKLGDAPDEFQNIATKLELNDCRDLGEPSTETATALLQSICPISIPAEAWPGRQRRNSETLVQIVPAWY